MHLSCCAVLGFSLVSYAAVAAHADPIPVQVGFDGSSRPFNAGGSLEVEGVTAVTWTAFGLTSDAQQNYWLGESDLFMAGLWSSARALTMTITVSPGFTLDLKDVAVSSSVPSNPAQVRLDASGTAAVSTWSKNLSSRNLEIDPPQWTAGEYAITIAPTSAIANSQMYMTKFLFGGELVVAPEPSAAVLLLGLAPALIRRQPRA